MRCPFCHTEDSQVKDSRTTDDGSAIRRRRICPTCGARFTTFERVQLRELNVIKKNGSIVPFDRDKLAKSLYIATRTLEEMGETDIHSEQIGQLVMNTLLKVDKVAYIRYASVYKNFNETKDFEDFIKPLLEDK